MGGIEQTREEAPDGQPHWRQLGIVDPMDLVTPVVIVGAGGIGSPTAVQLAKMGVRQITIFDQDNVESHNYPNQSYRHKDIGRPKVEALEEIVFEASGVKITPRNEWYINQKLFGIVIAAVDKMSVRKAIWEQCKYQSRVKLLIDARMAGQSGYVWAVNPIDPGDIKLYGNPEVLFADEDADPTPCTERAIIYNVDIIAGQISSIVRLYANNLKAKNMFERSEIPYKIEVDSRNFTVNPLYRKR